MKKRITAISAAVMILFAGCTKSSDTKPLKEITSDIMNSGIEFPEMVEVEEDYFRIKYGLEGSDYEEFSLWWAGSGADADEVCIVKTKDTSKVKSKVEERRESQKTAFKDYVPEQYDKLCRSEPGTKGDFVYWVCTNDNTKAEKIVDDNIK